MFVYFLFSVIILFMNYTEQEPLFMKEIDGVRRKLEFRGMEVGDKVSDCYEGIIDLATSPEEFTESKVRELARLVFLLNNNLAATSSLLAVEACDYENLVDTYNSVISQINILLLAHSDETGKLKPIDDESLKARWSGCMQWN